MGLSVEDRIGTVIGGRYRVDRVLGRGGMGVVFAARHQLTDRPVAIKVILPQFAQDTDVLARFFQEAKTAAALAHPNVVDTLDMGVMEETGEPYLVLELLDGTDLAHLLADRGRMTPEELLPIVLPVLDALAAAHEHSIVHRDLKPENLFIGHDARGRPVPKLLDFGIAKLVEGDTKVKTRTGGVLGTPQYMSPEQAMASGEVGAPSDVWAMGVLLYECLSGERPYDGDVATEVLISICTLDPRPIREVCDAVPPAFAAVVHHALQRKVEHRYDSAEELGAALLAAAAACEVEVPASVSALFEETRERIGDDVLIRSSPRATGPIEAEEVQLPRPPPLEEAPAPEPHEGGRGRWLALGAVGVLVAAAAALVVVWPADEPPVPTPSPSPVAHDDPLPEGRDVPPPPPEEPETILPTRRVESEPPGAEVYERGVRLGVTPIDVAIDAETDRTVELRMAGRRPREVTIGASSAPVVRVSLPPAPPRIPGRRRGAPELVPR